MDLKMDAGWNNVSFENGSRNDVQRGSNNIFMIQKSKHWEEEMEIQRHNENTMTPSEDDEESSLQLMDNQQIPERTPSEENEAELQHQRSADAALAEIP